MLKAIIIGRNIIKPLLDLLGDDNEEKHESPIFSLTLFQNLFNININRQNNNNPPVIHYQQIHHHHHHHHHYYHRPNENASINSSASSLSSTATSSSSIPSSSSSNPAASSSIPPSNSSATSSSSVPTHNEANNNRKRKTEDTSEYQHSHTKRSKPCSAEICEEIMDEVISMIIAELNAEIEVEVEVLPSSVIIFVKTNSNYFHSTEIVGNFIVNIIRFLILRKEIVPEETEAEAIYLEDANDIIQLYSAAFERITNFREGKVSSSITELFFQNLSKEYPRLPEAEANFDVLDFFERAKPEFQWYLTELKKAEQITVNESLPKSQEGLRPSEFRIVPKPRVLVRNLAAASAVTSKLDQNQMKNESLPPSSSPKKKLEKKKQSSFQTALNYAKKSFNDSQDKFKFRMTLIPQSKTIFPQDLSRTFEKVMKIDPKTISFERASKVRHLQHIVDKLLASFELKIKEMSKSIHYMITEEEANTRENDLIDKYLHLYDEQACSYMKESIREDWKNGGGDLLEVRKRILFRGLTSRRGSFHSAVEKFNIRYQRELARIMDMLMNFIHGLSPLLPLKDNELEKQFQHFYTQLSIYIKAVHSSSLHLEPSASEPVSLPYLQNQFIKASELPKDMKDTASLPESVKILPDDIAIIGNTDELPFPELQQFNMIVRGELKKLLTNSFNEIREQNKQLSLEIYLTQFQYCLQSLKSFRKRIFSVLPLKSDELDYQFSNFEEFISRELSILFSGGLQEFDQLINYQLSKQMQIIWNELRIENEKEYQSYYQPKPKEMTMIIPSTPQEKEIEDKGEEKNDIKLIYSVYVKQLHQFRNKLFALLPIPSEELEKQCSLFLQSWDASILPEKYPGGYQGLDRNIEDNKAKLSFIAIEYFFKNLSNQNNKLLRQQQRDEKNLITPSDSQEIQDPLILQTLLKKKYFQNIRKSIILQGDLKKREFLSNALETLKWNPQQIPSILQEMDEEIALFLDNLPQF